MGRAVSDEERRDAFLINESNDIDLSGRSD